MISRYLEHVLFESEVDWVTRYVLEAITRGNSLGKKLVEVGICIAAGLKGGPVREGLRMLAGPGVMELNPSCGIWVANPTARIALAWSSPLASLNTGARF
ncbi:hypothetical protein SAMN02927923_04348 [Microvirga guangxiensis]|uniref:Uncharacterized protein n=1 Tax=Microvirga guangxiensis TaxID=549386 RepID=A0A1G5LI18_9HYPH|nr:hypothetical protein SAMN02927923_04348 [Microvirga guangxiensis]